LLPGPYASLTYTFSVFSNKSKTVVMDVVINVGIYSIHILIRVTYAFLCHSFLFMINYHNLYYLLIG
jgi:hypothetical protein